MPGDSENLIIRNPHDGELGELFDQMLDDPNLWDAVRAAVRDKVNQNFDSESYSGAGWDALAPSTVRIRGSSNPILDDEGALRSVATSLDGTAVDPKGAAYAKSIGELTHRKLTVGMSGWKALHQYGYNTHRGNTPVPARPFFPWADELADDVMRVFDERLDALVEQLADRIADQFSTGE